MNYKLIKGAQIEELDRGFIKVKQLLSQDNIKNMSVSIIKIDGTNKKIINHKSDSVYFVLKGKGVFNINGEEIKVEPNDLVFIAKGTAYFDKGKLTLLAVNNPRYDQSAIEYLQ